MTESITFAKFQPILEEFANFQKFRLMKESGKMLEPQVNYSNMSQVSHACLKLSFLIKRHCFGDVCKISSDPMQYGVLSNEQTYHRERP